MADTDGSGTADDNPLAASVSNPLAQLERMAKKKGLATYEFVLLLAAKKNNLIKAKQVLSTHVNVNVSDPDDGMTPLMHAAQRGDEEFVKLLLEHDARLNMVNHEKNTALHLACQAEHQNTAALLATHGGDLYAENKAGWCAIDRVSEDLRAKLLDAHKLYTDRANTDPTRCTVVGPGLLPVQSTTETSCTIQSRNQVGKLQTTGGDRFQVELVQGTKNIPSRLVDNQDGTYTVYYTPALSGLYQMHVTLAGAPIANSPFRIEVRAGGRRGISIDSVRAENQDLISKLTSQEEELVMLRKRLKESEERLAQMDGTVETNQLNAKRLEELVAKRDIELEDIKISFALMEKELREYRAKFGVADGLSHSDVIKTGWLCKEGLKRKSWKVRLGVLFSNKEFCWFAEKGRIDLKSTTEISVNSKDGTVNLVTPDRTLVLQFMAGQNSPTDHKGEVTASEVAVQEMWMNILREVAPKAEITTRRRAQSRK
mmetsp:Transcript_10165/g.31272  ORF Transcript_10165/g.31272 Transcript_10165/m.31272 type:complete len:485 (+) Transcript_10165:1724-3178(+)